MTVLDVVSSLDRMHVQQKFAPLVNRYQVSTVGPDGRSPYQPLAFVQERRFKIREQIDFYTDESRSDVLLRLRSRKVLEVRGRADVLLPDGTLIGSLQKVFKRSLWRSTWQVLDPSGTVVATAHESSVPLAILRRAWGAIPYLNNVPFFLPFHFDILIDDRQVGRYTRIAAIRDRYLLDLTADPERRIDRRVALALTIALDALQDR